jgi:ribonuclease P protein component
MGDYSLPANERLKKKKEIQEIFQIGKSIGNKPLRLLYIISKESDPSIMFGVTVPSKKFAKAVDRNRIKRLIRESYRLQVSELKNIVHTMNIRIKLFFIYSGDAVPTYGVIFMELKLLINQLTKKLIRLQSTDN